MRAFDGVSTQGTTFGISDDQRTALKDSKQALADNLKGSKLALADRFAAAAERNGRATGGLGLSELVSEADKSKRLASLKGVESSFIGMLDVEEKVAHALSMPHAFSSRQLEGASMVLNATRRLKGSWHGRDEGFSIAGELLGGLMRLPDFVVGGLAGLADANRGEAIKVCQDLHESALAIVMESLRERQEAQNEPAASCSLCGQALPA